MKFVKLLPLLVVFVALSCSSDDGRATDDALEEVVVMDDSEKEEDFKIKNPCDLVSADEMIALTGIDESFKLTVENKIIAYPTCVYRWDGILVNTKTYELGEAIESELPAQINVVMIRDKNEADYQRAIKTYVDPQNLTDIGEMAVWGDRLSQLTFLEQNHVFHVYVNVDNSLTKNRAIAEKIAKAMVLAI